MAILRARDVQQLSDVECRTDGKASDGACSALWKVSAGGATENPGHIGNSGGQ